MVFHCTVLTTLTLDYSQWQYYWKRNGSAKWSVHATSRMGFVSSNPEASNWSRRPNSRVRKGDWASRKSLNTVPKVQSLFSLKPTRHRHYTRSIDTLLLSVWEFSSRFPFSGCCFLRVRFNKDGVYSTVLRLFLQPQPFFLTHLYGHRPQV